MKPFKSMYQQYPHTFKYMHIVYMYTKALCPWFADYNIIFSLFIIIIIITILFCTLKYKNMYNVQQLVVEPSIFK